MQGASFFRSAVALVSVLALVAATFAFAAPAHADRFTAGLRTRVQDFVRARQVAPFDAIDVPSLEGFALPGVDPRDVRVELSTRANGTSSAMPVTVVLSDATQELKRGVVTARVRSSRSVWVAARHLQSGDLVAEDDLRLERYGAREAPVGATSNLGSLVGKQLQRSVREGRVVRAEWVDEPAVITRGQRVRLRLEKAGLRIEGMGRAVSDAALGEQVRVINLESRREVSGRATAEGLVLVDF